ncbi:MAG: DUF3011 domain-containing protein [Rudaea sp.]
MSIRSITGYALLAMLCGLPGGVAHAQQGYGYGGDRGSVECRSNGYGRQVCRVPWRDARIIRQLSDTRCVRGQNWGIDRYGLWVDNGCAARFVAADGPGYDHGGGWSPPPRWDHRFEVSCSSPQYQRYFCSVDAGGSGRIYLQRQTSKSACIEGRTWGWNRAGIWVDQGCAGIFTVDRRWH